MTDPGGTRHYGLQEIKPVAQLAALSFEFDAVTRHGDFADHDRRMEELARQAAVQARDTTLEFSEQLAELAGRVAARHGDQTISRGLFSG